MRIHQKIAFSHSVCAVTGHLSSANALDLQSHLETLAAQGVAPLILDLTACEVTQPDVLYRLAAFLGDLALVGCGVRVVASSPGLRRLFDVTRLDAAVEVYSQLEAALTQFGNEPPRGQATRIAG